MSHQSLPAQQDIPRPRPAVGRSGGAEGEDLVFLAQPRVYLALEHWQLPLRTVALAVNDAHAASALGARHAQKSVHALARLRHGVAVQIELRLDRKLAATEFPQHQVLQPRAHEEKLLPGFDLGGLVVVREQVLHYLLLIALLLLGDRLAPAAVGRDAVLLQRTSAAHGFAETVVVCPVVAFLVRHVALIKNIFTTEDTQITERR